MLQTSGRYETWQVRRSWQMRQISVRYIILGDNYSRAPEKLRSFAHTPHSRQSYPYAPQMQPAYIHLQVPHIRARPTHARTCTHRLFLPLYSLVPSFRFSFFFTYLLHIQSIYPSSSFTFISRNLCKHVGRRVLQSC
jgi:hypothetical protein